MLTFRYKVKTKDGETKSGNIDAVSQDSAVDILHQNNYVVYFLKEETNILLNFFPVLYRVKKKDLVIFSRQLSLLMRAKIPLVQSLSTISKQTQGLLNKALMEVADDVRGGTQLSKAFYRHPYVFPELFVSIIKLGEVSGTLEKSFNYLADYYEKEYNLQKTVQGALIYPIFVIIFFIAIAITMTIFVIPNLVSLLKEVGQDPPLSTRILIGYNSFLIHYWWLVIFLGLSVFLGITYFLRTELGKRIFDRIKLKTPIMGSMLQKVYITRFAEGLSTMIKGGLPIVKGIRIVADSIGNSVYTDIFLKAAEKVQAGSTMSSVFVSNPNIPPLVAQMVNVGEKTGKLDISLGYLADFFNKEVEAILNNLQNLLMPVIMLFLAGMIGFFAFSILMPIYGIYSGI